MGIDKQELIDEAVEMIMNDSYEYREFIQDLIIEALSKKTKKELKEILG